MKLIALALALACSFLPAAEEGFTQLYNGKDLTGWNKVNGNGEFKINGEPRVDYTDEGEEFTPEGFFALQVHSGKAYKIRWRIPAREGALIRS